MQLLEIGEVDQWNGETLRQRELKIREAALILGGQCIALLIYQLSQLKEVQETAQAQTIRMVAFLKSKTWHYPQTNSHHGQCQSQVKITLCGRKKEKTAEKKDLSSPRILPLSSMVSFRKRSHTVGVVNGG